MQTKSKIYRNGWYVQLEKSGLWYSAIVRTPSGDLHDKMRCDDYRMALEYYRAFKAIAKAQGGAP